MKKLAAVAAGLAFSAVGHAGMIVDTIDQSEKLGWTVGEYGEYIHSYQHDLSDQGFVPGSAVGGHLTIEFWDDDSVDIEYAEGGPNDESESAYGVPQYEAVAVWVEGFYLDPVYMAAFMSPSDFTAFSFDLDAFALSELNADGFLDIKIEALEGDFYVGDSTLEVAVPEPASLALLGLGLAGLGVVRKRHA